jgi:hypothetical protein
MQPETLQKTITYDELLDAVEVQMHMYGVVDIPVIHTFTPGLYTRSMVDVPPGTYLLSYNHTTEHQFIMSKGQIVIYTKEEGMKLISAPYLGKTYPDTRRLAKTYDYVTWTSIHATSIYPASDSEEDFDFAVKQVEEEIFEKRENIFLIKAMEELQ